MSDTEQPDVTALTVQLLSAYLSNNTVAHTDVADLVRTTKAALIEESTPASSEPEGPTYTPAVSVRRSTASQEHILSLIDGKPYKTLKRHLASHGLTPESYRERYSLPANYPMVAPGFAAQRRAIAERIGLGRPSGAKPVAKAAAPATASAPAAAVTAPAAKAPAKPAAKAKAAAPAATKASKPAAKPAAAPAKAPAAAAAAAPVTEAKAAPSRNRRGTLKLFKAKDEAAPKAAAKPKAPVKAAPKAAAKPKAPEAAAQPATGTTKSDA